MLGRYLQTAPFAEQRENWQGLAKQFTMTPIQSVLREGAENVNPKVKIGKGKQCSSPWRLYSQLFGREPN